MRIKRLGLCVSVGLLAMAATAESSLDPVRFVNPFIGTVGSGHCTPAAARPFGLVQAGPDTAPMEASGYNGKATRIVAFSQTHLNGTGCWDLGDIGIMPFTGAAEREDFASDFDKTSEFAEPGYYRVELKTCGVTAEATATERVGVYRFTWNGTGTRRLLLNPHHGVGAGPESRPEGEIAVESPTRVTGWYRNLGWVDRRVFFAIEFSEPSEKDIRHPYLADDPLPGRIFTFGGDRRELIVRIAISTRSIDGARRNLKVEAEGRGFDAIRAEASAAWRAVLGRMSCPRASRDDAVSFYTSLYHLFLQPNVITDVGEPRRYSTFSLWDTYRAAHPLYELLVPELVPDFVNSMLEHRRKWGYLPIWSLWGIDNHCMIGHHAVPVVVSAALKGFPGVDAAVAFEAVRESLRTDHAPRKPGRWYMPKEDWNVLDKYGYYPTDLISGEGVSRMLECTYDDWCAAQLAERLGKREDADFFRRRAAAWTNVFDRSIGFVRGRDASGRWRDPFDPMRVGHSIGNDNDFTEGNAYHWTWHVLHDPQGLFGALGGTDAVLRRLDGLFTMESTVRGDGYLGDVVGLIGQYVHGNEPCHHIAYLYTLAGRRDLAAKRLAQIFRTMYRPRPDGLCGNDDCGEMSAWYLLAALGFYPVNPASGEFVLGDAQLPCVRVDVPDRPPLVVRRSSKVKAPTLNGAVLARPELTYDELCAGGVLEFPCAKGEAVGISKGRGVQRGGEFKGSSSWPPKAKTSNRK